VWKIFLALQHAEKENRLHHGPLVLAARIHGQWVPSHHRSSYTSAALARQPAQGIYNLTTRQQPRRAQRHDTFDGLMPGGSRVFFGQQTGRGADLTFCSRSLPRRSSAHPGCREPRLCSQTVSGGRALGASRAHLTRRKARQPNDWTWSPGSLSRWGTGVCGSTGGFPIPSSASPFAPPWRPSMTTDWVA
jgi:hypothetical protein